MPPAIRTGLFALSCALAVSACAAVLHTSSSAKEAAAAMTHPATPGNTGQNPAPIQPRLTAEGVERASTSRHLTLAVVLLAFATLMAPRSVASGHIGPFPIEPQKFRNFAACKAHLEEQHANDVAMIKKAPAGDGYAEPERSLETEGVVQTGKREAHYDVVKSYVSRLVMDDLKTIKSQYSYEEGTFVCKGRTLTGSEGKGYHLHTFESIE